VPNALSAYGKKAIMKKVIWINYAKKQTGFKEYHHL
jgi:hypothetical protein